MIDSPKEMYFHLISLIFNDLLNFLLKKKTSTLNIVLMNEK